MVAEESDEKDDSVAFKLIKSIGTFGIEGSHVLCSAKQLANEYRGVKAYANVDAQVDALIAWESGKSFASGFLTGLGGLLTLPISIPGGLAASWIIQARLAGTVAELYGHNSGEDRVQTFATLCILGDAATQVLKAVGVEITRKGAFAALERIPGAIFIQINKQVGFRLITKAGEKGAINIVKVIPLIGGAVGGSIDWTATRAVGKIAKKLFRSEPDAKPILQVQP